MRFLVDSAFLTFVSESLQNPRSIGALVPSSRALASAMARQVVHSEQRTVVELGAGTGVITAALIELGVPHECLCLIESNRQLAARLRKRFSAVRVVEGDATRLLSLVQRNNLENITAVVSGLPLRTFDQKTCRAVLEQSFEILCAFGSFTQFTYNVRAPVSPALTRQLALVARKVGQVWFNLPPASIWQFRRALTTRGTEVEPFDTRHRQDQAQKTRHEAAVAFDPLGLVPAPETKAPASRELAPWAVSNNQ